MKVIGVILVILGLVALVYGGITYTQHKTVLDMGPIQATATEQRTIPLPPILGVLALIAGVVLLAVPPRRV